MTPNLRFCYGGTKKDLVRFSDDVSRCLLSHQAPVLQSLHVEMNFKNDSTMDVGVMIGVAFGLHVRELELQVYSCDEPFRFPRSLYNCATLETLKLHFDVLVDVPSPVCLKALRTLRLYSVSYKDEVSIVNLLSGCSRLENLEVEMYSHPHVKTFTIDNMPELVEAHITDVAGVIYENIHGYLTSAKRLCLEIESPLHLTKFPTDRIFNQLVYLELSTDEPEWRNLLMLMLDSSLNLQVLKLVNFWVGVGDEDRVAYKRWSQPKNFPECLVNHLETLVWKDYEGEIEDEKEVAQYILRNASRLNTATFSRINVHAEKNLEMFKELASVDRASKSCQLVFKETDVWWKS
ncbi:hypothetical protein Bca101_013645 [Brassica carinata]